MADMDHGVTITKQLDILYESGARLSEQFAEVQWALQQQEKEWREEEEQGKTEDKEWDPKERASQAVDFEFQYQRWYSICLPLMKQQAPDRYAEFKAYYLTEPKRDGVYGYNYAIQDYFRYLAPDEDDDIAPWTLALRSFLSQLLILKAVRGRLEWQSLCTDDQAARLLQLEELETARDLIKVDERAAGALAGTVLEGYLKKLAAKHQVKLRKQSPPPDKLADALKAAKVLDAPAWSQCTWLADLRARCLKAEGEAPT